MTESSQTPDPRWSTTASSWVWALAPLYTLGLGSVGIHAYAALRRRSLVQAASVPVYLVALVLMLVFDRDDGGTAQALFDSGLGVNLVLGLAHSLSIRSWVYRRTDRPTLADQQAKALAEVGEMSVARRNARELADRDPGLARELNVGRPDVQDRSFPDGGLVDVNSAEPQILVDHLGLTVAQANRIVEVRETAGGFDSAAELGVMADISPATTDALTDRMIFLPYRL